MARYVTRQSINEAWEDMFLSCLFKAAPRLSQDVDWQAVRHYRVGGYSPKDAAQEYIEHRIKELAA